MLGAIIGDLAAWTWENDHMNFYPQLVSLEAELSDYAHTLLVTCDALMHDREIPIDKYRRLISLYGQGKERIESVVRAIAVAWLYEDEEEMRHAIKSYCLWDDKEEIYAASFMAEIIYSLRHGTTKKEAGQVDFGGTFYSFVQNDNWKKGTGTLSILIRAWNAFYYAFDYTSAIHKAMKLPGNRQVNTILTGAFAEAMYSCEMTFLKKKYRAEGNWYNHIVLPDSIIAKYSDILNAIKQHKENVRVFFPKNRALTNVELHNWITIENPFQNIRINTELRRRILKAFDTGWEARYGFYLDDGFMSTAAVFFCTDSNCTKTMTDNGISYICKEAKLNKAAVWKTLQKPYTFVNIDGFWRVASRKHLNKIYQTPVHDMSDPFQSIHTLPS